ncbi:DUF397 domain-containing protein [Thermobifida alba]
MRRGGPLQAGAAVRDSEHRELGHLVFDTAEWQAFLTTLKNNEL